MAKEPKVKPDFPLVIEVTRSFPLRKIQAIKLKDPMADYGNTITIDREQAVFLLGALSEIVNIKEEKSEPKEADNEV